ncbi:MAG: formate dehydrogenase accessory sulfurtransferase FdhD [Rhodocyclaceae bacterium]|nr:formate dehydrogenase accessory sulfurtransferase FdhD [Rhodocyclaceae bacterium]
MSDLSFPPAAAHGRYGIERQRDGVRERAIDALAEEVPVALSYNGVSHAVMLATPEHVEDFAVGFSLSECIVERPGEITDLEVLHRPLGIEVRMRIIGLRDAALRGRRRSLAGRTGCGLCGVESLEQLSPRVVSRDNDFVIAAAALPRALVALGGMQALHRLTGAVHAAAWCGPDGELRLLREDVGRHNALDKMIGALANGRRAFSDGFALMTSRASYEIVQKAAAVGIPAVAAVSAPTGMAVRLAQEAGITLVGFLRGDRHCVYSHPERVR